MSSVPLSRYDLLCKLASGGMGTVYVGRVRGPQGFSRLVAIKRAHVHLADDPAFSQMLMDEAMLASKISHPHVVSVLDVERVRDGQEVDARRELRLVMDYVEGATLGELGALARDKGKSIPPAMAVRIVLDAAAGLQAAHELTDEAGDPLGIVHRDVSPHNILIGIDGMARVSDFGIAKATMRPGRTTSGSLKGKLAYMAPEYVGENALDARSDVFSLGIVAWEMLTDKRLFKASNELATLQLVASGEIPLVSSARPDLGTSLDDVVAVALDRDPQGRFGSARAFATALESEARKTGLVASHSEVAQFVRELVKDTLDKRRSMIRERAKELDATRPTTSMTVSGGDLRAAVDAATAITASAAQSASVPEAPSLPAASEGTLDGTGKTGRTPRPRSRVGIWIVAFVGGVSLAICAVLALGGKDNPKAPAATSTSSTPTTSSSAAPVTVDIAPATASTTTSAAAAAPVASSAPSATTSASVRTPPLRKPTPNNDLGLPPNPYGQKR